MAREKITLEKAREELAKKQVKTFRVSDFVSEDEKNEIKTKSYNKKPEKSTFSAVDAYIAEILARFGFQTYQAWKAGDISEREMLAYINAERARDAQNRLAPEAVIISSLAGAQQPRKSGGKPPIKTAVQIFKNEQKLAKGGR